MDWTTTSVETTHKLKATPTKLPVKRVTTTMYRRAELVLDDLVKLSGLDSIEVSRHIRLAAHTKHTVNHASQNNCGLLDFTEGWSSLKYYIVHFCTNKRIS